MTRILAALIGLLIVAACGSPEEEPDGAAAFEGFIRLPSAGANMSAGYLSVMRDEDDRLVGASVEGVARTELHTVTETDGVSRMRPVKGFDVKAGEPLVLQPGGHHLMLIGITTEMAEGQEREVSLRFESGVEETVTLPVRRNAPGN